MSERYGPCSICKGRGKIKNIECGICGGTGMDGDAMGVPRGNYVKPAPMDPHDLMERILEAMKEKKR